MMVLSLSYLNDSYCFEKNAASLATARARWEMWFLMSMPNWANDGALLLTGDASFYNAFKQVNVGRGIGTLH